MFTIETIRKKIRKKKINKKTIYICDDRINEITRFD